VLNHRSMAAAIEDAPSSIDEATRSVAATFATETPLPGFRKDPITGERRQVVEVLLMSGCEWPESGIIPYIDNHDYASGSRSTIGSGRELRVSGDRLVGRLYHADTDAGNDAWNLVRGGHIRTVSIGWENIEEYVENGVHFVTRWRVGEISLAPIPIDENAQIRAMEAQMADKDEKDENGAKIGPPGDNATEEQKRGARAEHEEPDGDEPDKDKRKKRSESDEPDGDEAGDKDKRSARELNRRSVIRSLGTANGIPQKQIDQWIDKNCSVEQVATMLTRSMHEKNPPIEGVGGQRVQINRDAFDTYRKGAVDALCVRAKALPRDKACPEAAEFLNCSFVDLLGRAMELGGHRPSGYGNNAVVAAARDLARRSSSGTSTTSEFTSVFANALNKMLALRFEEQETTWRKLARIIPANDLRPHRLIKRGGAASLVRIGESGAVPGRTWGGDKHEVIQPYPWAGKFVITETMIINDEIGAFADIASSFSISADRTINEYFWYTWLANANINEDGKALFHADHNNLITGGSKNPSVDTLNSAAEKFALMTDTNGKPLNLRPYRVVVPPALLGSARTLLNSTFTPGKTNEETNIWFNGFDLVSDAFLQTGVNVEIEGQAKLTAAGSAAKWYVQADPNRMDGPVVAFYAGETPQIREEIPIDVLGREYQVKIYFGCGWSDYRGVMRFNNA
jgi:hypothetical protein